MQVVVVVVVATTTTATLTIALLTGGSSIMELTVFTRDDAPQHINRE